MQHYCLVKAMLSYSATGKENRLVCSLVFAAALIVVIVVTNVVAL